MPQSRKKGRRMHFRRPKNYSHPLKNSGISLQDEDAAPNKHADRITPGERVLLIQVPAHEDISPPSNILENISNDVTVILQDNSVRLQNILTGRISPVKEVQSVPAPANENLPPSENPFHDGNAPEIKQDGSARPLHAEVESDIPVEPLTLPDEGSDMSREVSLISGIYRIIDESRSFNVTGMDLVFSPDKDVAKTPLSTASSQTEADTSLAQIAEALSVTDVGTEPAEVDFWEEVKQQVSSKLPPKWVCLKAKDSIKVLKFPHSEEVIVQRELKVSSLGQVSLKVHGQDLPPDHEVWTAFPEYDSSSCSSIDGFSHFVVALVGVCRGYEVCYGVSEERFAQFAKRLKDRMVYDDNRFKECRYSVTYRDINCHMLLQSRKKRCDPCINLKRNLGKRAKRLSESTPPKTMNNRYLNTSQKDKKLVHETKERRSSLYSRTYYQKKAQSMLNNMSKTVPLDSGLQDDFTTILERERQCNNLNPLQEIFFEEQLKYARLGDKRGMRWHPLMIRLALKIQQLTSDKVIDALNDDGIIRLPSSRTLFNYSHYHSIRPGLCAATINRLYEDMQEYTGDTVHQRFHVLMMDEMTISENLVQSHSTGELVGFVDLPDVAENLRDLKSSIRSIDVGLQDEESQVDPASSARKKSAPKTTATKATDMKPALASKMLTYMVKGVASDQKRVVAAYGVDVLDVNDLFRKTWNIVREMEESDVQIIAVVCDGLSVNRRFIKMHKPFSSSTEFGTVFDTVNPYGGGRPMFFFSDVPHLLKTIRNNFSSSGFSDKHARLLMKNKQFIVWQTIIDLYEAERFNHIRLAYKLNKQVVLLNNFSRMRVSYAAAVMSKTVANALREVGGDNISETIIFIEKVNDFFDCLNGAHSGHGKRKRNPLLDPYTLENKESRFKILRDFLQYLKAWKAESETLEGMRKDTKKAFLSDETFCGIDMTINAFIGAINYLLGDEVKAKFINARVFNQDPLEQLFSLERAWGGGSKNVNESKFMTILNKVEMTRHLGFKTRGNTKCYEEEKNVAELCKKMERLKDSRPKKKPARRSLELIGGEPAAPETDLALPL